MLCYINRKLTHFASRRQSEVSRSSHGPKCKSRSFLCYISSRVTFFDLRCRRLRLEHVIMWHFELSTFSIENRFLMTVHLWENCNFCRRLVFGFEVRMFWQGYRFWSPLLLESYWFRIKSVIITNVEGLRRGRLDPRISDRVSTFAFKIRQLPSSLKLSS